MTRAVEILATIYEKRAPLEVHLAPLSDRPIVLFDESISLSVGITTCADVEKTLGIAFSYPSRGWHTYAVGGSSRHFLSLFYKDAVLAAAELYVPRSARAPALAARPLRFRLVPGEVALGMLTTSLPPDFGRVPSAPQGSFDETFEVRFPGGVAYAMGCKGTLERLAIFGNFETPEK